MGIPDSSLLDQIDKVRSWISWGTSDISSFSGGQFEMPQNSFEMCCECDKKFTELSCGYHCEGCQQCSCAKCSQCYESPAFAVQHDGKIYDQSVKSCKFCDGAAVKRGSRRKYYEKVHPSVSPRESPETPSPCSVNSELNQGDRFAHYLEAHDCECSPHVVRSSIMSSFGAHLSQLSIGRSPSRSDNGAKDYETNILSPLVKFGQDTSDLDSGSVSPGHEFNSFRPVGSSPSVSPSRNNFTPNRVGHPVHKRQEGSPLAQNLCLSDQASMAILRRPDQSEEPENLDDCTDYMSVPRNQLNKSFKILDLESNGLMWYPPPPEDEDKDVESSFFSYDDEDEDDDVGDSCAFSSSSSLSSTFLVKEKQNERGRRPVRAVIRGHFRALVLQLLQCEGIKIGKEDGAGDWLDIVTSIAWQAANFVKPDTSRGGSMDPGDYVKVKCIASGKPSESTLVKGVVCTKNIKHKRMTSQFRNPRLFLLGGSLEFQKVPSQLASFNTLLEQEHGHLKMVITKIESLRPNVLLVEKSVSSCAQEYLLAKDISLVLNVKRPLLERIARCTGANICPSIDKIPATHLGHCELFRIERVSEELETANKFNRKPSKTLMFFDGCPRRLGCTVLLRGTSREELKKIKHVVQYAVFAAYHLSLETSYLADEGATLPTLKPKYSIALTERAIFDDTDPAIPIPITTSSCQEIADARFEDDASPYLILQHGASEFFSEHHGETPVLSPSYGSSGLQVENVFPIACNGDLEGKSGLGICLFEEFKDLRETSMLHRDSSDPPWAELQGIRAGEKGRLQMATELKEYERITGEDISSECFPASDMNQSILISFSSRCILKGVVCERSRLLRIKCYGCFDKPLGRYLLNDLFDQTSFCRSCKEPSEAHVICYTHQQGNLTINVRRLASVKLPGERDGKIWMWHRCLRCAHINGVPPATRRVVMSDAAWGLSFGKFLELSFSNHATANRIATCGHSLQRDCLRYYGSGSMVAFFRYSPIDIFSVHVPPPVLEFSGGVHQEWIRKDTIEFMHKVESLYQNIADVLDSIEQRSNSNVCKSSDRDEVWNHIMNHIMELKDQLRKERNDCNDLLQPFVLESSLCHETVDILELNRLRHELVIGSHVWDSQLHTLDSLLKVGSAVRAVESVKCFSPLKELRTDHSRDQKFEYGNGEIFSMPSELQQPSVDDTSFYWKEPSSQNYESVVREEFELGSCFEQREDNLCSDGEVTHSHTFRGSIDSPGSTLSDRIDSAWTGTDLAFTGQPLQASQDDGLQASLNWSRSKIDYPPRLASPMRVHSFNSALRFQDKIKKGLPSSSISPLKSFHASGDYISMVRDPVSNMGRTFSNTLPFEAQKLNFSLSRMPSSILCAPGMAEGAWLFLPLRGPGSIVISVYDNDPASIISYALSMKEYEEWLADTYNENAGCWGSVGRNKAAAATFSAWQSLGSIDLDYMHYGRYGSEDVSPSVGTVFSGTKRSPHLTLSFGDDTASAGGKVQFFVTCYFAKQFDSLRKRCCPSELNLLRSLSRCQKWSAQGGKSNVYFAKSMDDRFIIKQVKKTELESFQEFAPEYFNYMTDSLSSGSPTCLTKILGIYQVCVKHLKGGRETKMDLMVMENLFFQRSISKVYDLKGSARSRYNPDTAGANKVLLDMNMLETLRTEPIFLGSKAKRSLERAIWNDTNFLASVDVMDYSLLVGVDDEHKELVLGIIDFMRQYTWDKHLETWVKASGILGGPKNTSPTIVSPKQYKKRFRKAMTSYFLTVPEQWTS